MVSCPEDLIAEFENKTSPGIIPDGPKSDDDPKSDDEGLSGIPAWAQGLIACGTLAFLILMLLIIRYAPFVAYLWDQVKLAVTRGGLALFQQVRHLARLVRYRWWPNIANRLLDWAYLGGLCLAGLVLLLMVFFAWLIAACGCHAIARRWNDRIQQRREDLEGRGDRDGRDNDVPIRMSNLRDLNLSQDLDEIANADSDEIRTDSLRANLTAAANRVGPEPEAVLEAETEVEAEGEKPEAEIEVEAEVHAEAGESTDAAGKVGTSKVDRENYSSLLELSESAFFTPIRARALRFGQNFRCPSLSPVHFSATPTPNPNFTANSNDLASPSLSPTANFSIDLSSELNLSNSQLFDGAASFSFDPPKHSTPNSDSAGEEEDSLRVLNPRLYQYYNAFGEWSFNTQSFPEQQSSSESSGIETEMISIRGLMVTADGQLIQVGDEPLSSEEEADSSNSDFHGFSTLTEAESNARDLKPKLSRKELREQSRKAIEQSKLDNLRQNPHMTRTKVKFLLDKENKAKE